MRKRYSTDTIIAYKKGNLSKEQLARIPRSTRQYWKKIAVESFFTPYTNPCYDAEINTEYCTCAKDKYLNLKKAAKALGYLVMLFTTVCKKHTKRIFNTHPSITVQYIYRAAENLPLKRILKWTGLSYQQFYSWVHYRHCSNSLLNLCRRKHPSQLTNKETGIIKFYATEYRYIHYSNASLYYRLLRDKASFFSISTWYKYLKLLNIHRTFPKKKYNDYDSLKAVRCADIIHIDTSIFRFADGSKCWLYVIRDNFSRCLLHLSASFERSASCMLDCLTKVMSKICCNEAITVVTDDGCEFKNPFSNFADNTPELNHIIAQVDIRQSNSMVEAANKMIKYNWLKRLFVQDFESLQKALPVILAEHNDTPMRCLYGLTPLEAWQGALPDKNRFKEKIEAAMRKRRQYNQKNNCTDTCRVTETGSF